jgi:glycerol-3-phosphate dehydrogenase (NAD+)
MSPKRVCIIGSGNWGSAISRLVGENTDANPDLFHRDVYMWVFEEMIDGRKLTEIINETHENVKYLPGKKLPENVVAIPDICDAAGQADVIIFVIPHQFMERALSPLKGKLKPGAVGISLIKGFMMIPGGGIKLMSDAIHDMLDIEMGVLMGANLAGEVAADMFCETTIAFKGSAEAGKTFKKAFQTPNFRVVVVKDVSGVEMCGALKNIVACGAGFVDGLKLGDNTKVSPINST